MKNFFIHLDQMDALRAIADAGTFEGAARELGISTSAISQRIKALESSLGRVLVRRATPCTMTEEGARVLRYARQYALLTAELSYELGVDVGSTEPHIPLADHRAGGSGQVPSRWNPRRRISVAVNADSLATWFPSVLAASDNWDIGVDVSVADEAHTASLLRDGQVMCAVSSSGERISGCHIYKLGFIRYVPVVSRELVDEARKRGLSVTHLPMLSFDSDDDLQLLALERGGFDGRRARYFIPSPEAFRSAIECGLGWGMLPEGIMCNESQLLRIEELPVIKRQLYWHRWGIRSDVLDRLTETVMELFPTQEAK